MSRLEGGPANGRSSPTSNVSQELDSQELLPGLPDFLTVKHISTRIPWQSVHALSLVSRGWRREIRTREVHRVRVRAHSTEEFVVLYYMLDGRNCLFLYSMRENRCLELPTPPKMGTRVAFDGRLYVIGRHHMYVLDLAGERKWERCSGMNYTGRKSFGCGVLHEKIYVFGGFRSGSRECSIGGVGGSEVYGSEVYDPEQDIWSPLCPMISFRCLHSLETLGEEFLVYGGFLYSTRKHKGRVLPRLEERACFSEVFNPSKNEWRVVERDFKDGVLFTARGKLYALSRSRSRRGMSIHVLDVEGNSTEQLHSNSEPVFGLDSFDEEPRAVLAVENELLALLWVPKIHGFQVVRSRGFGDESGQIVWEKVQFSVRSPRGSPDPAPVYPQSHPYIIQNSFFRSIRL